MKLHQFVSIVQYTKIIKQLFKIEIIGTITILQFIYKVLVYPNYVEYIYIS